MIGIMHLWIRGRKNIELKENACYEHETPHTKSISPPTTIHITISLAIAFRGWKQPIRGELKGIRSVVYMSFISQISQLYYFLMGFKIDYNYNIVLFLKAKRKEFTIEWRTIIIYEWYM